jgi:hypothetical protein
MTAAELVILAAVVLLLTWMLRPLQRMVRNFVERLLLRRRHGKVIEGRFRTVGPNDSGDGNDPGSGRPN